VALVPTQCIPVYTHLKKLLYCLHATFKMCPIAILIAVIMAVVSCFCSTVKLKLLTMARVSCNKHSVNTCTLVAVDSSANPERVQYDVHCSFHASKLEPQSTCMLSLGRSV